MPQKNYWEILLTPKHDYDIIHIMCCLKKISGSMINKTALTTLPWPGHRKCGGGRTDTSVVSFYGYSAVLSLSFVIVAQKREHVKHYFIGHTEIKKAV